MICSALSLTSPAQLYRMHILQKLVTSVIFLGFLVLSFFLSMVYIFIQQKIGPEWDQLQHFCTFAVIFVKYSAPMSSNFFSVQNMGHDQLKKWVYWMSNRGLLLTFLYPFQPHWTPLPIVHWLMFTFAIQRAILGAFETFDQTDFWKIFRFLEDF